MEKISAVVRTDNTFPLLKNFEAQGYSQVYFEANPTCCEKCKALDGNVYVITQLLNLSDGPLYWISHPNCVCTYKPVENSKKIENKQMTNPQFKPQENVNIPPTQIEKEKVPGQTEEQKKEPWYKKLMPGIKNFFTRKKSNYKQKILRGNKCQMSSMQRLAQLKETRKK
jgi:hypothetical protein